MLFKLYDVNHVKHLYYKKSTQNKRGYMGDLDLTIRNLEIMRDELMKASFTRDNYNSEWGRTLEKISYGLQNYASELKENKQAFGDLYYV